MGAKWFVMTCSIFHVHTSIILQDSKITTNNTTMPKSSSKNHPKKYFLVFFLYSDDFFYKLKLSLNILIEMNLQNFFF